MTDKSLTYRDSGVDIAKGSEAVRRIQELAASTRRAEVVDDIGNFAGAFQVGTQTIMAGADGVGSKLLVAQALNIHDTVGIDLVAMNVNDL
ncbi:MAG: phosphoribosylformylglycinamidine cyclo-ligase, partial [Firmicutes bacterium]|nr:phosphoribosylformylglycinamidine cyclo-ligase [Bacillota bacterium]